MRWLILWLTLEQALWIDVPFVQQDKNGCGSASVWMVMQYWKPDGPSLEEIHQQLYSKEAGGVYARDMERYLEAHGYRVFAFHGEWDDLEHHISQGRPLIVCLERNARGVPLHYVVVAGVDPIQSLVLVNDPAQRKLLSIDRSEFERSWRTTDNWTLLAVPEVQLASNAFREEKLSEAREHLNSAIRSNPADAYANDFLATVHYLQNNTESALKYWNRVSKPEIENIRVDPPLRIDPVLLDRAFTFSRGSVLSLDDFRTTLARLDATGVFSRYRIELSPAGTDHFDVTLRAVERNGTNLLSWFRGLPFQTVNPELTNIRSRALNVRSMIRWDSNKRRLFLSVDTPLRGDPKWKLKVSLDGRQENWANFDGTFRMRKAEAAAEIHATPSGLWNWTSGFSISQRHLPSPLLQGLALKYRGSFTRTLVRNPERRLNVDSSLSVEAGRLFDGGRNRFSKLQNNLSLEWFPEAQKRNYELMGSVRIGRAFGNLPFDEYFLLGLDRDSDLWLRAHSAIRDGVKNSNNLTRSFLLTNLQLQRVIHDAGFFRWSAGPFLDTARSRTFSKWVLDAGIHMGVSVLGSLTLNLSYGRNLGDGPQAFFMSADK